MVISPMTKIRRGHRICRPATPRLPPVGQARLNIEATRGKKQAVSRTTPHGQDRKPECRKQDASVQVDHLPDVQVRRHPRLERVDSQVTRTDTCQSARHRQYKAFGQHLADDSRLSASKGDSCRQFLRPRRNPRQEQARDVDASHQQDHADRAPENHERTPDVLAQASLERDESRLTTVPSGIRSSWITTSPTDAISASAWGQVTPSGRRVTME